MKKKILVVLLVGLILLPLTAAAPKLDIAQAAKGRFGLGVNLGSNLGASLKWDNKTWDLFANIGVWPYSYLEVMIEPGAEFPVASFKTSDQPIDLNVGFMVPLQIILPGAYTNTAGFAMEVLGTIGISYEFRQVPIQLYTRFGLGLGMEFINGFRPFFGWSGALGFVYLF